MNQFFLSHRTVRNNCAFENNLAKVWLHEGQMGKNCQPKPRETNVYKNSHHSTVKEADEHVNWIRPQMREYII